MTENIFIVIDTFGTVGYFSCMISLVEIRVNEPQWTNQLTFKVSYTNSELGKIGLQSGTLIPLWDFLVRITDIFNIQTVVFSTADLFCM